jgi:riboflavin-specific deaminase-like protein
MRRYVPGMRRLFPDPVGDVDIAHAYRADTRKARDKRPWVVTNFITSLDGAVAVGGRSGELGNASDKAVFHALRAVADVILVGAGTVRAESYGPPRLSPADQERRRSVGQALLPRIAVVSGRLDLDPAARVFNDPSARPLVLTTSNADARRRADLEPVADLVEAGATTVDPVEALARLGELGAAVVLCEGGPTLHGALLAAGSVDEVCVSVAPLMVSGDAPRMSGGAVLDPPTSMQLDRVVEDDGYLFLRYLRNDRSAAG